MAEAEWRRRRGVGAEGAQTGMRMLLVLQGASVGSGSRAGLGPRLGWVGGMGGSTGATTKGTKRRAGGSPD
eukprot:239091-Pyramimonas_sp.AAC.1